MIQNAHDHLAYDQPIVENGVIMTSTGCYAQNMGVLSLQKNICRLDLGARGDLLL